MKERRRSLKKREDNITHTKEKKNKGKHDLLRGKNPNQTHPKKPQQNIIQRELRREQVTEYKGPSIYPME